MCDGRRKNLQRLPTVFILVGLVLAFLACGCVSVRYALAEDGSGGGSFDYGVVYGPNSAAGLSDSGDPRYLVQVYAPNNYYAALLALGYNPTSSSFTADAKAYLSNQSTGGAFYDFAQLFSNNNTDWGDEITATPTLVPGIDFDVTNMETALRLNNSNYGAANVWSAEYATSQRIAAVTAVGLVLSGSVGGGSPGTGTEGYVTSYTLQFYPSIGTANLNVYQSSFVNGLVQMGSSIGTFRPNSTTVTSCTLYATSEFKSVVDAQINAGRRVCITVGYSGSNNNRQADVAITAFDTDVSYNLDDSGSWTYVIMPVGSTVYQTSASSSMLGVRQAFNSLTSPDYYARYGTTLSTTTVGSNGRMPQAPNSMFYGFFDTSNPSGDPTTPTVPPTNWPDPPESPTVDPPSVPDPPSDDPIQQPTDTPIQPPNVWTPIVSPTDPTFTVDLQGILDAMATHCQHIRDNLDGNFSQLYNNMTDYWSRKYTNFKQFLDGQFGYIGDTIVDETDDLMDYLKDLFEWLAEQFDFSVTGTGYNDNTVVSWLRRIYNRLGGGTTIRPPDPVVDPKGIGDWLNQLLQNLVLDLLALGQDVLADLVESFRELITKFPFSIPWDIAAILALLVAEPQAPVLEVPQYTYTGISIQQVGTYRLDLSQWNSVMDIVRPMETILFAGWLAFKTDFFKGLLEMTKG